MNIYNARMIYFLLLMFSMRLCVINSLLVVCFYNGFKKIKSDNILHNFMEKQYVMAIIQCLWTIEINL